MKGRVWRIAFLLLATQWVTAQDSTWTYDVLQRDSNARALISRYLADTDSIDQKITRLVDEAKHDDSEQRSWLAILKFQAAIMLEEHLSEKSVTSFDLYRFAGDVYSRINPVYGLQFYAKATTIALEDDEIDANRQFVHFSRVAGVFSRLGIQDSAAHYYRIAMQVAPGVSPTAHASSYNNYGIFNLDNQRIDSARYFFHRALHTLPDTTKQIVMYCSIRDNLASIASGRKDYQYMLDVYTYNDSVYASRGLENRYVINKVRLLQTKQLLRHADISAHINSLSAYIDRHIGEIDPLELLKAYKFAADFYLEQQAKDSHLFFANKYIALRDTLDARNAKNYEYLTSSLLNIQASSFQKDLALEKATARHNKAKLRSARILISVVLLTSAVIILFLVLYIKNKRQKHAAMARAADAEVKAKEMEARLARQELELKKKDLTQVVLQNSQVHDATQKVISRLSNMHDGKDDQLRQQVRSLLHELEAQNRVSETAISLQQNIDTVNAEFNQKLIGRFPGLTKAEQELCGFLRINLSTKDISLLKGIEATSVKMSKNRLRKKLGIAADEDLYLFIQRI